MPAARPARSLADALLPALAVVGVVGVGLVLSARSWPLVVTGLLDESAHLLTAWLALAAVTGRRTRIWPWALLGAVVIDVDHVPLYLWNGLASVPGGRPVTHSLATVLALLVLAALAPRFRVPLLGLGVGVLLHFLRDLATGPGLPWAWPVTSAPLRLPYWSYLVVLFALAATAAVRSSRTSIPAGR